MGNAKEGSGESIKKPIKYRDSGAATSFAGLDTFSAAKLDTKVRMSYDMRGAREPVAISGMEAVANKVASTKITDLIVEALEETQHELMNAIGTMIYGDGTGNTNKDFIGLDAIVDDGTSVSTIGGLSRTTYDPVLNATRTASGGTLSLAKLATLFSAVSDGTPDSTPTLLISNETVWDLFEQLLTPTVSANYNLTSVTPYGVAGRTGGFQRVEGFKGSHGFQALSYKGIPWVRDPKSTAQTVWMLNEKHLQWYGWDGSVFGYKKIAFGSSQIEDVYGEPPMSNFSGFNWSGWNTPTNQYGAIADVILLGNLTSWAPRRHGRLTGITGV